MTTEFIYGLKCPITDTIMYVGRSIQPTLRLGQHMATAGYGDSPRAQWLAELKRQDLRPEIVILEECSSETVKEREIYWIKAHKLENPELKNTVMSYANDQEQHRIGLRVAPSLYEELVAVAKAKHMSLNSLVTMALERATGPSVEARLAILEEKVRYLTDGP